MILVMMVLSILYSKISLTVMKFKPLSQKEKNKVFLEAHIFSSKVTVRLEKSSTKLDRRYSMSLVSSNLTTKKLSMNRSKEVSVTK